MLMRVALLVFTLWLGCFSASARGGGANHAPKGMVLIPAGSFWMGCNPAKAKLCESNEKPGHEVSVPDFFIDKREVSVADYARCMKAGKCRRPADGLFCNRNSKEKQEHPVNCVSWHKAQDYCKFVGKRLPTEAEWEKAARGVDRHLYPWGDDEPRCDKAVFDNGKTGCGRKGTWPIGSKPLGASPYNVLSMAGNVSEWVEDPFHRNYQGAPKDGSSWEKPQMLNRITRGGSLGHPGIKMRIARRQETPPDIQMGFVGFRCAKDGS